MEISRRIKIAIIVVLLVLFGFAILLYQYTRHPYGPVLDISNIDQYTRGNPSNSDRLEFIKSKLYKVVELNVDFDVNQDSVGEVLVREGSFIQELDTEKKVHKVKFIVDIERIKQSYAVTYQWQDDVQYSDSIDQYGTQVTCLPVKDLVFGDFSCKDERIMEVGADNYDPVGSVLPHVVKYKYEINSYRKGPNKTVLDIDNPYIPPRDVNPQAVLNSYKVEINDWLKSEKLDPTKYEINFVVRSEFENVTDPSGNYGGDGVPPEDQP